MKPIKTSEMRVEDWISTEKVFDVLTKDNKLTYRQLIAEVVGIEYNPDRKIRIKCWEIIGEEVVKVLHKSFGKGEVFLLDRKEVLGIKKKLILSGLK